MDDFHPTRVVGRRAILLGIATLSAGIAAGASAQIPQRPVVLSSKATIKGRLKGPGNDTSDHVVPLKAGQTLSVMLSAKKSSTYFNVLTSDASAEALYRGELEGKQSWKGKVTADGNYTVRVFLNRAASRRGAASSYTLTVTVT